MVRVREIGSYSKSDTSLSTYGNCALAIANFKECAGTGPAAKRAALPARF